jgi:hypothetical protein
MIDIRIQDTGSVFVLYPVSDEGRAWLVQHFPHDRVGSKRFACSHNHLGHICDQALIDEMVIELE